MRTEELIEQCLQALASGQELPPDLARYLARHPEQRSEVEDLLAIAQSVTQLPPAKLSRSSRTRMQERLAQRLNFDQAMLNAPVVAVVQEQDMEHEQEFVSTTRRKLPFSLGRLSVARLRYAPPPTEDPSEARIRAVFRDLTPDDIRRYIGVRGEDYLYFRQGLPGWEPVFALLAFVLRSFKRLEKLMEPGP